MFSDIPKNYLSAVELENQKAHSELSQLYRYCLNLEKENNDMKREMTFRRGERTNLFKKEQLDHWIKDPEYLKMKKMEDRYFEMALEKQDLLVQNNLLKVENLSLKRENNALSTQIKKLMETFVRQSDELKNLFGQIKDVKSRMMEWLLLSEKKDLSEAETCVNKIMKDLSLND